MAEHQHFLTYGTPLVNYLNPAILRSLIDQTDTPAFTEATNGPDSAGFLKAMELETVTLICEMETFDVVKHLSKHKVISLCGSSKSKGFLMDLSTSSRPDSVQEASNKLKDKTTLKPSPLLCSG